MEFKNNFFWGAATAAYQIEGAADTDGKGPSVWDTFCEQPGKIWRNQNGRVACDHYHRFREDVALMRELGIKAYRFSIAWPRVLPAGIGKVNPPGLAFYDQLVDELLAAGIAPFVTLFHWDYPYALYQQGGWLNAQSPDWFADYARLLTEKLSDRVKHWITFNEPQCFIWLGHSTGYSAPGDKLELKQVLQATHHVLLAHGKAVQAMRAGAKQPLSIGLAATGNISMPIDAKPGNVEAARGRMFAVDEPHLFNYAWWTDPLMLGRYPEDGVRMFGAAMPQFDPGDLKSICQSLDFCAANIYNGDVWQGGSDGQPVRVPSDDGHPLTAYKWKVSPEALYWGPRFLWERYKLPVIITENGMSNADWVHLDGQVHDSQRIDYTTRYLRELRRAAADGVDIGGYFHWTFMDNFEWAEGFKERFGLVYVDYKTQQRVPKDSAYWYRTVIESNGAAL